jgi:hypothetical protein
MFIETCNCIDSSLIIVDFYRITMLYKITNNLIAVDPKLYLTPQPSLSTSNNNPLQYQIISTRTNYYKYSFSPHAVVLWNSLPYTVVNAGSLD